MSPGCRRSKKDKDIYLVMRKSCPARLYYITRGSDGRDIFLGFIRINSGCFLLLEGVSFEVLRTLILNVGLSVSLRHVIINESVVELVYFVIGN